MCYSAVQGYGNEGNGRLKETFYPKMFPSLVTKNTGNKCNEARE